MGWVVDGKADKKLRNFQLFLAREQWALVPLPWLHNRWCSWTSCFVPYVLNIVQYRIAQNFDGGKVWQTNFDEQRAIHQSFPFQSFPVNSFPMKATINSSKFCSSKCLTWSIRQISSDFSTVKVLCYTVVDLDIFCFDIAVSSSKKIIIVRIWGILMHFGSQWKSWK